jgi:hypothetical protein
MRTGGSYETRESPRHPDSERFHFNNLEYVIVNISALVGGAILWIVYFSELRTKFLRLSEVVGAIKQNAA